MSAEIVKVLDYQLSHGLEFEKKYIDRWWIYHFSFWFSRLYGCIDWRFDTLCYGIFFNIWWYYQTWKIFLSSAKRWWFHNQYGWTTSDMNCCLVTWTFVLPLSMNSSDEDGLCKSAKYSIRFESKSACPNLDPVFGSRLHLWHICGGQWQQRWYRANHILFSSANLEIQTDKTDTWKKTGCLNP